ncbi:MAG: hypothetical protein GWP91_15655, partial [Rhodobacterales bacterium]|nr:hypothetical protein [Rhodobacterales bacterium]
MKTIILALMLPSVAWAWPADSEWIALTESGLNIEDPIGDQIAGDDSFDLVGDATTAALHWYADSTEVFFRLQLNGDPMAINGTDLKNQTWAVLIDTNGDDTFELALASEGFDGDFSSYLMDGSTPGIEPGPASYGFVANYGNLPTGQVRATLGPVTTWFIDFRISRADLATDLGVGDLDPLRVAGVTGFSIFTPWDDVTRCNGACATFSDAAADVIIIDQDLDGWTDTQEVRTGTDPLDADADDDGLIDGLERDGDADGDALPDAFDCDADNDGILDGTEAGAITATLNADTALAANCFVADQDTVAPNTEPYHQDTDGGGLDAGLEDRNYSGRQALPWETAPNVPADDVDSDG